MVYIYEQDAEEFWDKVEELIDSQDGGSEGYWSVGSVAIDDDIACVTTSGEDFYIFRKGRDKQWVQIEILGIDDFCVTGCHVAGNIIAMQGGGLIHIYTSMMKTSTKLFFCKTYLPDTSMLQ